MTFVALAFAGAPFEGSLLVATFVFGNILMNGLLIYHRHKTRDRWIRAEAARWLRGRSRSGALRPRMKRALQVTLWGPSLIALATFLFFPETLGIGTHLFRPRPIDGYAVQVPLTWIVAYSADSYLWVVAGRGIGRVGFAPYWHKSEPISDMIFYASETVGAAPPKWLTANLLPDRTLQIGTEALTCWNVTHLYFKRLDPDWALVDCYASTTRFRASFSGSNSYLEGFYGVLRSLAPNSR